MAPKISIISWVSDYDKWNNILHSHLSPLWKYQRGSVPVEFIAIDASDNCLNMSEAYELGRLRSNADIRCYLHQDMTVVDPSFYLKLVSLAHSPPRVGAYGFVGSTVYTGASWMHAPHDRCIGVQMSNRPETNFSTLEMAPVKLVDGFGFITMPCVAHPWPHYSYPGIHMVVEHMTMRLRTLGWEIWTIDCASAHESVGTVDESYWTAARIFYEQWKDVMGPEARHPDVLKAEVDRYILMH